MYEQQGNLHPADRGPRRILVGTDLEFGMSLDFYLTEVKPVRVFDANITHNLNKMAEAAGIYKCLWRPDENCIEKAHQMIEPLSAGLADLLANPAKYRKFDAPNGWGTYENFVGFVKNVLTACIENPNANIEVSR